MKARMILLSPSKQMRGQNQKLGQDKFQAHPSLFIITQPFGTAGMSLHQLQTSEDLGLRLCFTERQRYSKLPDSATH
jgi:hypothetical protein